MLAITNVSYSYPKSERFVLRDISVSFAGGRCTGILGPNGTGKSTLLKCLNRIHEPKEGTVCLEGRNLFGMSRRDIAKYISYVPQYYDADISISVLDTVLSGRFPYAGNRYGDEDRDAAFSSLEELQIEHLAFKDIRRLSGGEKQRVFIARALAGRPRIVLLDEPTSSLDIKNQLVVMGLLNGLAKRTGMAVIFTIHDLNLAAMFCDDIVLLKDGTVLACGTPAETLTELHISEAYGVKVSICRENGTEYVHLLKG